MSDSESSTDTEIVPKDIREKANSVSLDLLPDKSKKLYVIAYNTFKKWRSEQRTNSFCEDVMLAYFSDLAKKYAPSSLWSTYSMLRASINSLNQIDISSYKRLISYLKKQSKGYVQKKSVVFTKANIIAFFSGAPDDIYLCEKVALIFGIAGALRRNELVNLTMDDIQHFEDMILVKIFKTKNNVPRSFTINGPLYDICRKYMAARPESCTTNRFFLRFTKGHCVNQPIGINTFGNKPKNIAKYLNLLEAESYTGHSFRRTSATLLADAGADMSTLMRHGGWKSVSVTQGYIADSLGNKKKMYEQISSGIVIQGSNVLTTTDIMDNPMRLNQVSSVDFNAPSTSKQDHGTTLFHHKENPMKAIANCPSTSTSTQVHGAAAFQQKKNSITAIAKSPNRVPLKERTNLIPPQVNSIDALDEIVSFQDNCQSQSHQVEQATNFQSSPAAPLESSVRRPVFYDPDIGLYVLGTLDENPTMVFNNCNVTIHGSNSPYIFIKSKVKHQTVQTDE